MRYREIGKTGCKSSIIGLGGAPPVTRLAPQLGQKGAFMGAGAWHLAQFIAASLP
jgi:hypothetical protein